MLALKGLSRFKKLQDKEEILQTIRGCIDLAFHFLD